MGRFRIWFLTAVMLIAAVAVSGCSASERHPDGGAGDGGGMDAGACGDGKCGAGENCLNCPADCSCSCGDGVCTHGEFCAVCPADCDCTTLSATPPMGWNSWNQFACNINETLIWEMADAFVSSGMKEAGYVYLNLDDCWQESRAVDGTIQVAPDRFSSGMPALADYVHSKGLKFGLYTCAGTMTCQKKPGSWQHEAQDMKTYADWEVDYVKVDWCFTPGMDPRTQYALFRDGIAASGRPLVLSICNWGVDAPWVWGPQTGQLWRTTGDISATWNSMISIFDSTSVLAPFASAGHWNDPDMLEVGVGGLMSDDENKTHFSLWSIIAAPLIAGNDLRSMTEKTKEILTNREVVAVNQDPLGLQGTKVSDDGNGSEVWARPVALAGGRAAVLFNRSETARDATVKWDDLGLAPGKAAVRDLWKKEDAGEFSDAFTAKVKPHGVVMVLVKGSESAPPAGESYLSDLKWMHAANYQKPVGRNKNSAGGQIKMNGRSYDKGLGTHVASVILYNLDGRCVAFSADVGVDDVSAGKGTVAFEVWGDGEKLYDSGKVAGGTAGKKASVDLTGRRLLKLVVTPAGDDTEGDYADWADARIICK